MFDVGLVTALRAGRLAVEEYVTASEAHGDVWGEVQASSRLMIAAASRVDYCPFNPREEKETGADWLWWWIDATGECFGMLVQAKKLHHRGSTWSIDFGYGRPSGDQMRALFRTADTLSVPPIYMFSTGDVTYRDALTCGPSHAGADCRRCREASVPVLSALVARDVTTNEQFHPELIAVDAFHCSSPLESLVDPKAGAELAYDLNLRRLRPELADLLVFARQPQTGARQVAKAVLAEVSRYRRRQFAAASLTPAKLEEDAVFATSPGDIGHFGVPYFRQILRCLRRTVPDYLADIMADREPPADVKSLVAGVVVVHI